MASTAYTAQSSGQVASGTGDNGEIVIIAGAGSVFAGATLVVTFSTGAVSYTAQGFEDGGYLTKMGSTVIKPPSGLAWSLDIKNPTAGKTSINVIVATSAA